ncbi:MAG: LPP20 family lipoprotein [Methylobacter sp.]
MNTKYLNVVVAGFIAVFLVTACSHKKEPVPEIAFLPQQTITATGYGTVEKTDRYSRSQIRLMAMRASKMDAYRSLAEQLNGMQLRGHTGVEDMQVTHDTYSAYLNTYLRGARVKRTLAIGTDLYAGDDTFETVVELDLTPRFYECVNGSHELMNQCIRQIESTQKPSFDQNLPPVPIAPNVSSKCNTIDCYGYPNTKGFGPR